MTKKETNAPLKFDPVRKQIFVENLLIGLDPVDAVRAAGFVGSQLVKLAKRLMHDEDVQAMLEAGRQQIAQYYDVSREKVLRDLVDAKEMARVQGDPKSMVYALQPIIDIQGYRAPVKVDTTHRAEPVKKRLRTVSDAELADLAGQNFELLDFQPVVLDGEFTPGEKHEPSRKYVRKKEPE